MLVHQSDLYKSKGKKTETVIIFLIAAILGTLAAAKLGMIFTNFDEFQGKNELLTLLPNWFVALFAAVLELLVMRQIIRLRRKPKMAGLWLIWISILISFYRGGLYMISPHSSCKCFGLFGIFFRAGSLRENHIAWTLLLLFFLAGLFLYLRNKIFNPAFTARFSKIFKVVLLTVIISPVVASASNAVKITGEIRYEFYNKDGVRINSSSSRFEVFRDGTGWRLIAEQPPSDVYTIASDGYTAFSLLMPTNETRKLDSAFIDPVNFPIASSAESVPWWFFIFSKNIDSNTLCLPTPWSVPRVDFQSFFCTRQIVWSKENTNLLDEAAFYYSSNSVISSMDSKIVNRETPSQLLPAGIVELAQNMNSKKMLAGECRVLAWTNTLSVNFPLEFQVLVYPSLAEQEQGEEEKVRIKISGKIKDISGVDAVDYTPPLKKPIYVRDFRFRDPEHKVEYVEYGPLVYWVTNKADVDLSKIRKMVKTALSPKPINTALIRHVVVALLLLSAICPIVIFFYSDKTQKKQ